MWALRKSESLVKVLLTLGVDGWRKTMPGREGKKYAEGMEGALVTEATLWQAVRNRAGQRGAENTDD